MHTLIMKMFINAADKFLPTKFRKVAFMIFTKKKKKN